MTGEDHTTEALIAALRSPALPSERGGESAAVAAMLDAMPKVAPVQPTGRRPRRGLAIAAVTVASLGVGGLVAAGPGRHLLPGADRSPSGDQGSDAVAITDGPLAPDGRDADDGPTTSATLPAVVGRPSSDLATTYTDTDTDTDPDIDPDTDPCRAGNHGELVSDVARTSEPDDVRDAATSDCGRPDGRGGTPASTAPGQTGDTPASTAPGQTGDTPASTAPGREPAAPPPPPPSPPAPPDRPAPTDESAPGGNRGGERADGTDRRP